MHRILCTAPVDRIFKLIFNNCSNHHKQVTKKRLATPYIPWGLVPYHSICCGVFNDVQKTLTFLKSKTCNYPKNVFHFAFALKICFISEIHWNPQEFGPLSQVT